MTQIKWKAAFLAFLLASSLHGTYTVQAEKGVTTATHIRRHESSTTISTETVKTESKSSTTTKGVSITPPSIGILVFPDEEDEPDRKSTRLNSSHIEESRMPSSA